MYDGGVKKPIFELPCSYCDYVYAVGVNNKPNANGVNVQSARRGFGVLWGVR